MTVSIPPVADTKNGVKMLLPGMLVWRSGGAGLGFVVGVCCGSRGAVAGCTPPRRPDV